MKLHARKKNGVLRATLIGYFATSEINRPLKRILIAHGLRAPENSVPIT